MTKQVNRLYEHYHSLPSVVYPKSEFIKQIVQATGKSHQAVRTWISDGSTPKTKQDCIAVARLIGAEVADVFPHFETRFKK